MRLGEAAPAESLLYRSPGDRFNPKGEGEREREKFGHGNEERWLA